MTQKSYLFFSVTFPSHTNFFESTKKIKSKFGHYVRKGRLVNTVLVNFNTTMG